MKNAERELIGTALPYWETEATIVRKFFRTKPTHMQGAPKPIMEEMVNRCDAVITGLGA